MNFQNVSARAISTSLRGSVDFFYVFISFKLKQWWLDLFWFGHDFHDIFTEEPVDLSVFSPACLPHTGHNPIDGNGHIYGNY